MRISLTDGGKFFSRQTKFRTTTGNLRQSLPAHGVCVRNTKATDPLFAPFPSDRRHEYNGQCSRYTNEREIVMSDDVFSEITHESWFSRLGGAIKGVLVGLLFFIVAFPLLFWNEGRAVERYKTLKEGGNAVVSVPTDNVDSANAGKLIHVTGKANTEATLTDSIFGVSANAIRMERSVEMYQWTESTDSKKEKKLGGGTKTVTTYSYNKEWSDSLESSSQFKKPDGHENPAEFPFSTEMQNAKPVTLDAFELSPSLVRSMGGFESLPVTDDIPIPDNLQGKAKVVNQGFYIGDNPASPQVGDLRVKFTVVKPNDVSIIAQQIDNTFEPYRAKAGGTIELLQMGVHSSEAMIQAAQDTNALLTWILRLVGFFVMALGLGMILRPLSVFADVLPLLGDIVGAGTGIIAVLTAGVLSLITIAIAWLFYRPVLGIILIVAAVGLVMAVRAKLKSAHADGSSDEGEAEAEAAPA